MAVNVCKIISTCTARCGTATESSYATGTSGVPRGLHTLVILPAPDVATCAGASCSTATGREINFSCHRAAREIAIFQPSGRAGNLSGNLWRTLTCTKSLSRNTAAGERQRANDAAVAAAPAGTTAKASNRILTA